jgi:TetR/AcrR family transcriptional regulator, tetracycline repressor protein
VAAITNAGLESLDELGLDKLNMRAVAARLGVQAGALYYYVPNKSGLLRLMADRLCSSVANDLEPGRPWREDAVALCLAVRRTLLGHRDGARIFARSPLVGSPAALGLMERLMTDLAQGVPSDHVAIAADTLFSYVTGFVLQEQHEEPGAGFDLQSLADLQRRFPRVFATRDADSEKTFRAALDAILAGFTAGTSSPLRP